MESQISQLHQDLKKAKDQLSSSESWKTRAEQEAEDSKGKLLAVSSKLEDSQKQLSELSASEEAHIAEIQQLKLQLEMVAESEAAQSELQGLKEKLAETLSLVEDMKNQLQDCKESEARAQAVVSETLLQLETAKKTVDTLRSDGMKANEAYDSIALELNQSRARVESLEGLVRELNSGGEITENGEIGKSMQLEAELTSVKAELGQLRTELETAEVKYHEEQTESTLKIRSANEVVERIKSELNLREAELEAELNKTKADVEELKANLMDKETELQCISEENEGLHMKLEKSLPCKREYELEKELKKAEEDVADLKANLMDKETELQNISEENEMLKLEIKGREMEKGKAKNEIVSELEAVRVAEREALLKLGYMSEEVEKSNRRAARVEEQLEASQAATSEMEAELRRLKVQSDQWRKAAEAAAAMLSAGNNANIVGRAGKFSPPDSEDIDDDLMKKKNGNVLKKIGVLWKKPQK